MKLELTTFAPLILVGVFAALAGAETGIAPVGPEFQVTRLDTEVGPPSVCSTPAGGLVVARSQGAERRSRILVKRFDGRGNVLGPELVVSTYAGGYAVTPDVACDDDGGFAVAWTDRVPLNIDRDGVLDDDVLARVFDASGEPLSDPFVVNTFETSIQELPAICAQGDGRYAVTWHDKSRDEIDARVISAAGPVAKAAHVVDNPRAEMPPDVACAKNGNFLVVWGDFPSTAVNNEVGGRLFSADGTALGPRIAVNEIVGGDQGFPVACSSPANVFVVAWRDSKSVRGVASIAARQLSLAGVPTGHEVTVSPEGRNRAAITCGATNGFVVTTRGHDGAFDVLFAQAMDGRRRRVGAEAIIDDGKATGDDVAPAIAGNAAGRFAVVWPRVSAGSQTLRGRFFHIGEVGGPTTTTTTTTTLPGVNPNCGDATQDGTLTVLDALTVLRATTSHTGCDLCHCDVDGSGRVALRDAVLILDHLTGDAVDFECPVCQ